jgi:hypothetical protein
LVPAPSPYAVEEFVQIRVGKVVKIVGLKIIKAFLNESTNGTERLMIGCAVNFDLFSLERFWGSRL